MQELFLTLARNSTHTTQVANMRAYLFTALRHAVGKVGARSERQLPQASLSAPMDIEGHQALREALAQLTAAQREVVALTSDGGLTFDEIGAVLRVPPAIAASCYRAALVRLRAVLTESCP